MRVIGTAGHVDHGKSTLVAALTGTHPDRLKEEQAREMTIELGFAWLKMPDGEEIGIVDVPGHRDFIENMLAGVGGIDAVLFVVAADEGVMPQTREHLAILDLLQIPAGLIVLTKIDMVDDPDWLDLVEADVIQAVQGTILQDAPVVRVSARKGLGLEPLKQKLGELLAQAAHRQDLGRARLPVDRAFSMPGFGTVVTGTLLDGSVRVGDEVELLPAGLRGRVRGLQSHKKKEEEAVPGSRTAVNVSGINLEQVKRGDVLAAPDKYRAVQRLDLFFRMLPDASAPLKHSAEVKFFIGASEVLARARVLGSEEIQPGQEGWLQLETQSPVVAVRGDRYILRRPSPGETIGGGSVVNPQPSGRHKRFSEDVLAQLEAYRHGAPADVLFQAALALGAVPVKQLTSQAKLGELPTKSALDELIQSRQLLALESGLVTPQADLLVVPLPVYQRETAKARQELAHFHKIYPLRKGMGREELKSKLKLAPRLFISYLKYWLAENLLVESGLLVYLPDHTVNFSAQQQAQAEGLLARFTAAPYSPPTLKECQAELGEEIIQALIDMGRLVQVSPEVVFNESAYHEMVQGVKDHLENKGAITVAEFRDKYNTSRRFALALLEHLDALGVTVREGDQRKLKTTRR
jgi:selenocysteine-specific elongation factor